MSMLGAEVWRIHTRYGETSIAHITLRELVATPAKHFTAWSSGGTDEYSHDSFVWHCSV